MDKTVTGAELLTFAPPVDDGTDHAVAANLAVEVAHGQIGAYCRGRHVDRRGNYRPGIRSVVLTVGARILANPGQISSNVQVGAAAVRKGAGFSGFTLSELSVLDRYRKRGI